MAVRYTSVTGRVLKQSPEPQSHLEIQVPIQTLEGAMTMIKKITFAAIAALSLLAGPALAGPNSGAPTVQYNGDFQLQGR
jgi:hypothetical protein